MTPFEKLKSDTTQIIVMSHMQDNIDEMHFDSLYNEIESAPDSRSLSTLYAEELFELHYEL